MYREVVCMIQCPCCHDNIFIVEMSIYVDLSSIFLPVSLLCPYVEIKELQALCFMFYV